MSKYYVTKTGDCFRAIDENFNVMRVVVIGKSATIENYKILHNPYEHDRDFIECSREAFLLSVRKAKKIINNELKRF